MDRLNTNNAYVWNYGDHFLVECPMCRARAHVLAYKEDQLPYVRLSCTHCGHIKQWQRKNHGVTYCQHADLFEEGAILIGAAVDWYFHLPLWLQISCCGETLWAYNAAHLAWLKSFASAKLRERGPSEQHGWSNQSLASRLPKWLKKASNRGAVLSAIVKLEAKIE